MPHTVIQLFAKLPIAGEVKTRMIAQIGKHNAAAVYRHCLQFNLQLIQQSPFDQQLWLNRHGDDPLFAGLSSHIQRGKDLGEKMFHALSQGLKHYKKCILLGSDCLELDLPILQQVDDQLSRHQLVIVPAEDGGYVLIAARDHIHPGIFDNIDWSTPNVLKQTLIKCMQHNIKTFILPALRDIDHVEDLKHYPELKPYLNEIDTNATALFPDQTSGVQSGRRNGSRSQPGVTQQPTLPDTKTPNR